MLCTGEGSLAWSFCQWKHFLLQNCSERLRKHRSYAIENIYVFKNFISFHSQITETLKFFITGWPFFQRQKPQKIGISLLCDEESNGTSEITATTRFTSVAPLWAFETFFMHFQKKYKYSNAFYIIVIIFIIITDI